jgi:myo-inositol 2-dehydrogenase/D-chiro-inositol 1-dehydrogenase
VLRIAVIGAGRIGAIHAANVVAHPDATLAWVADPVPGAAERLAGSGARTTLDPKEAVAAPDVDAVMVCSPTPTHVQLIAAGVRAGKAVFSEKPVDLDIGRAEALLAEVERAGGRVMMGFNRRFDPSFAQIQQRVAAGEVGELEQLIIVSRDPSAPSPEYVASSGGLFRDMTIHDFDLARFFLGEIVSVQAVGQNVVDPGIKRAGDIDAGVVLLRAASGAVATIVNSRRCAFGYDQRLEAFGSKGMLQAENQRATSVVASNASVSAAGSRYQDFFLERYAQAYRVELDEFVARVADGGSFTPSLRDGCAALALANAALASSKSGVAEKI